MAGDHRDPTKQPVPAAARCVECGGELYDQGHNLHALGYLADDQYLRCVDCGATQTHGVPDGEADEYFWHDLECASCSGVVTGRLERLRHAWHRLTGADCDCGRQFARVHRVNTNGRNRVVGLTLKCPRCYHVWSVSRVVGEAASIVGWPMTTGELGEGRPWMVDGKIRPNEHDRHHVREQVTINAGLKPGGR